MILLYSRLVYAVREQFKIITLILFLLNIFTLLQHATRSFLLRYKVKFSQSNVCQNSKITMTRLIFKNQYSHVNIEESQCRADESHKYVETDVPIYQNFNRSLWCCHEIRMYELLIR